MKDSLLIEGRIEETRALIAAREAEVGRIPAEKEEILGAEEIDQKVLEALESRESTLAREVANLRARVTLLEKQREVAERREAAERLEEIVVEATRLVEAQDPALAELAAAERFLVEKAQAVAKIHVHHQELTFETVYLMDRYRLPRPTVPQLGERPAFSDLAKQLAGLFAPLSYGGLDSPWVRKRQQIKRPADRQRQEAKAA